MYVLSRPLTCWCSLCRLIPHPALAPVPAFVSDYPLCVLEMFLRAGTVAYPEHRWCRMVPSYVPANQAEV